MRISLSRSLLGVAVLAVIASSSLSAGTIVLGGNARGNLATALTNLGVTYTDAGSGQFPSPVGYGAGDVIIIGMDGGTDVATDYTGFLNAGGRLIVAGGSNWDDYRTWAAGYFNTTDTGSGWHTDGAWHNSFNSPLTSFLPASYTPEDVSLSYHMLAFLAGPNTTLLGTNDEGVNIAAAQTYLNGGLFYYMAMDVGPYGTSNDIQNFTMPFLQGALGDVANIPEPATFAAMAGGLALLGLLARRRA